MPGYRFVYVLVGLAALISTLALVGAIYQVISTRLYQQKYPPPGRLVDVDGYQLHINCSGPEGASGPTVVMDAGIGECSLGWGLVQPAIAGFARVCSYDRAGLGWSDSAPTPRTSRQIVSDLHALLTNAAIKPPYVLVGHSFGGLNARLFATQFPKEVAGIVLVDSAHENVPFHPPLLTRLGLLTAPLGIARLFGHLVVSENPIFNRHSSYPAAYRAIATSTKYLNTVRREWSAADENWSQARGSKNSLGDKPLVVLFAKFDHEDFPVFKKNQMELAQRSTRGKLIIVENSGHHIQHDQPDVVVDAIREVVDAVRRNNDGV